MLKIKIFLKNIVAIILAVSLFQMNYSYIKAETRSSEDSYIENFTIKALDYTKLPTYRSKGDSTPLYFWYKSAANNRYNYIFVRALGTGAVNCTLNGRADLVDNVTCTLGRKYSIRSNIYEKKCPTASLSFRSSNITSAQTISGAWSPDSVGTYEYAY